MTAFDFPASPRVGQKYEPVGGPAFAWDGVAWRVLEAPQLFATAQSRNRVCNPACQISQENGFGVNLAASGSYLVDQFKWTTNVGATARGSGNLSGAAPSNFNFIQISTGATPASLVASSVSLVETIIEGNKTVDFRWGHADAKPAVLRFSFYSNILGSFSVAVRNTPPTHTYLKQCVVSPASVWQEFVIPIPAPPAGTWTVDTSAGVNLIWAAAAGSNYSGTEGWSASGNWALASNTNWIGSANAVFRVANVGLYLDPDNTGLAPKWQTPDEAEELRACQRYYAKAIIPTFSGNVTSAVIYKTNAPHPVIMRIVPAYSGTNLGNSSFPTTVGTLNALADFVQEGRTANATANGGTYSSNVTANARM